MDPTTAVNTEPHIVRYVRSADFALGDPPTLEWCVQGLFSRPSLVLLVGAPGSKKTLLSLDLAVCVALGKPWLGRPVTQSPVLFIDEETGIQRFWARANAALVGHQATKETPFHFINNGNYDFRFPYETSDLFGHAAYRGVKFIVIDALADVLGGGDENNVGSVLPALHYLKAVAQQLKAVILILHHNNKHGGFRGSSAIAAGVDLMLAIESPPDSSLIHLRPLKTRDAAPEPFSAHVAFDGDRFQLTPSDEKPTPASIQSGVAASIVRHLAQHGPSSVSQLTLALPNTTPGNIRQCIHELVLGKHIIRMDAGSRGTLATYSLTPRITSDGQEP